MGHGQGEKRRRKRAREKHEAAYAASQGGQIVGGDGRITVEDWRRMHRQFIGGNADDPRRATPGDGRVGTPGAGREAMPL